MYLECAATLHAINSGQGLMKSQRSWKSWAGVKRGGERERYSIHSKQQKVSIHRAVWHPQLAYNAVPFPSVSGGARQKKDHEHHPSISLRTNRFGLHVDFPLHDFWSNAVTSNTKLVCSNRNATDLFILHSHVTLQLLWEWWIFTECWKIPHLTCNY